jgi:Spy/CpxP family protein refolding chaperone
MRARLPWILLGVSVVLNLAFIAGAAWIRFHPPPAPEFAERAERAGRALDLEPAQRAAFREFLQGQRASNQALREKNRPLLHEIRREFTKPTPDDATIDRLLAEVDANRRAVREQNGRAMREFLKTLSPEQRERFLVLLEPANRREGRGPPRHRD